MARARELTPSAKSCFAAGCKVMPPAASLAVRVDETLLRVAINCSTIPGVASRDISLAWAARGAACSLKPTANSRCACPEIDSPDASTNFGMKSDH
jgi:hypothetical protein